jgi:hypothetical protein
MQKKPLKSGQIVYVHKSSLIEVRFEVFTATNMEEIQLGDHELASGD